MKLAYTSPKMTVHGKVEELTQITGNDRTKDILSISGEPTGIASDDSINVDIIDGKPVESPAL